MIQCKMRRRVYAKDKIYAKSHTKFKMQISVDINVRCIAGYLRKYE